MANKLRQVVAGLTRRRKNVCVDAAGHSVPTFADSTTAEPPAADRPGSYSSELGKVRNCPTQIWSFTPDIAYALGHFREEKVVYYCVDDHASFSWYDKA
jgi:hypothetical protein